MTRGFLFWPCAVMAMLVAGCNTPRGGESGGARPPAAPVSTRPVSDSDKLLIYYEQVRKLGSAELVKEHEAARQLYAGAASDFARVRYAMLLSIPGAAFSDDARALDVLEPLLKNADAALHSLAFMVSIQIQEQRRGQALQQKLDALKSLEKSLIERDPGAGKKR